MRKLLYLIPLILVFLLSFSACGNDNEETIPDPVKPTYSTSLLIMLVDADGNNLLNPDNNPINIDGAKLLFNDAEYPLIDKINILSRATEMLPFGFFKFAGKVNDVPQVLLIVQPFYNPVLNKEHKLTLDWGNGTSDVIKLSYKKISDTEYGRNIYLNNKPCEDGIVKIVKEDIDVTDRIGDQFFRDYCLMLFDDNKDGRLFYSETRVVKEINTEGYTYNIKSLQGLEYFPNIESLVVFGNPLGVLNVSIWKKLKKLTCSSCKLTELNVSNNEELIHLSCMNNNIKELDVSKNTLLENFYCNSNKLDNLDVKKNKNLKRLLCSVNYLTEVDVSSSPELLTLYCSNNMLKNLNLTNNKSLERLEVSHNPLNILDISQNIKLFTLDCAFTNLGPIYVWDGFNISNPKESITMMCSYDPGAIFQIKR